VFFVLKIAIFADIMAATDMKWVLQNGDIDVLKARVEADASLVNAECGGRPPLHVAADYGQKEVLEYLVRHGADINATDKYGITPLLSAIYEGHTDCVKLLLSKGAKKVGKAPDGSSYLDCAEKEDIRALLQ